MMRSRRCLGKKDDIVIRRDIVYIGKRNGEKYKVGDSVIKSKSQYRVF